MKNTLLLQVIWLSNKIDTNMINIALKYICTLISNCISVLIILGFFSAFFAFVGFILNVLAILVLKKVSKSDVASYNVLSLACSDLFMCAIYLPLQSVRYWKR